MTNESAVVELRQYTLEPGQRDVLIDLFERHFLAGQEAVGAHVLGHFSDLDDADRFVWLRGFRDMPGRRAALEAFYTGPVWKEHRDAANATMIDSDDVLLLRPAAPELGFRNGARPAQHAGQPGGLYAATIWSFAEPLPDETIGPLTSELAGALAETTATLVAVLVTEPSENDYPALPVREGENVLAWLVRFQDAAALEAHPAALGRSRRWRELAASVDGRLAGPPQSLRLAPAPGSLLA